MNTLKKIVTTILMVVFLTSGGCQTKNSKDSSASRDEMVDKLSLQFEEPRKVKGVEIVLSENSLQLNRVYYDNINSLMEKVNTEFKQMYSQNATDSVLAIQIHFDRNFNKGTYDEFYDFILRLYKSEWESISRKMFNKEYEKLSEMEKQQVQELIPFYLNEYEIK